MNTLNRQHREILQILESSPYGMNSFQWRTNFIQLPVRIKEMKAMGYAIVSKKNKNRSVNYILLSSPQALKRTTEPQVQPHTEDGCQIEAHYMEYIKDNRKFFRHREDARQEAMSL